MNYKKNKAMTGKKTKQKDAPTKTPTAPRTMGSLPRPQRPPTPEQLYQMHKDRLVKQGIATAEQIDALKTEHGIEATLNGMLMEPTSYRTLKNESYMATLY